MEEEKKSIYKPKYKICVSGAAETGHCREGAVGKAMEIGREIARRGVILITGATTGIPHWAAKGAKEMGGIVIGVSPAASLAAHVKTYRLPTDYHDIIIYTGFGYSGRDLLLIRAADAVVSICGRMGTLHEFTVAFEDKKPGGVLEGTGGTADFVREILERLPHKNGRNVVFSEEPADLIDKVVALIKEKESDIE